jgi:hypothetical protein
MDASTMLSMSVPFSTRSKTPTPTPMQQADAAIPTFLYPAQPNTLDTREDQAARSQTTQYISTGESSSSKRHHRNYEVNRFTKLIG